MDEDDPRPKPAIVGIYEIFGCGKTTLITQLRECLPHQDFEFFDGSQMIYMK
jgi:hypothetical protein